MRRTTSAPLSKSASGSLTRTASGSKLAFTLPAQTGAKQHPKLNNARCWHRNDGSENDWRNNLREYWADPQEILDAQERERKRAEAELAAASSGPTSPPVGRKVTPAPFRPSVAGRSAPNLLQTFSGPADLYNRDLVPKLDYVNSQPRQLGSGVARRKGRSQHDLKDQVSKADLVSEEAFADNSDLVRGEIDTIRRRHQSFEPLSPTEQLKRQREAMEKAAEASGKTQLLMRRDPGELKELLDTYKFCRRVEPELPAMERLPPEEKPPPNESHIVYYSSQTFLGECTPKARLKHIAVMSDEKKVHHQEVAIRRRERKAAFLEHRRLDGMRSLAGRATDDEFICPGGLEGRWLKYVFAIRFALRMLDEVRIGKMADKDKLDFVRENKERLEMSIKLEQTRRQTQLVQMVDLRLQIDENENFLQRRLLIRDLAKTAFLLRRRRLQAKVIKSCLAGWMNPGTVFKSLKAFAFQVKLIQRWWRSSRHFMRVEYKRIAGRLMELERHMLSQEIVDTAAKRKLAPMSDDVLEKQVAKLKLEPAVWMRFVDNEMRARRYNILPKVWLYENDRKRWKAKFVDWHYQTTALKVIRGKSDVDVFLWPPVRPSHLPNERDLPEMCNRCRASHGLDWTQMKLRSKQEGHANTWEGRGAARRMLQQGGGEPPDPRVLELRDGEELDAWMDVDIYELPSKTWPKHPEEFGASVAPALAQSSPTPTPRFRPAQSGGKLWKKEVNPGSAMERNQSNKRRVERLNQTEMVWHF